MHKNKILCFFSFAVFLLSTQSYGGWVLNNNASSLSYVSSKVSAVSEVNFFTELSGSIDDDGNAQLTIALNSVDTSIDIRNQRVKDILFQVSTFPQANISLAVDVTSLNDMSSGSSVSGSYQVDINLHGFSQTVSADLQVTKVNTGALQVQLLVPLIINAANFGLTEGVEELREIAGLGSINPNVVVSFSLLFDNET